MKVLCPHCAQKYEVEQHLLGATVECRSCDKFFVLADNLRTVYVMSSDGADPNAAKSRLPGKKVMIYLAAGLVAAGLLGIFIYNEFIWQGPSPAGLAGYTLGGEVTNADILLEKVEGTTYNVKVLEPDWLGIAFPVTRLYLIDGADGVRIIGIECRNEQATPEQFTAAVKAAKAKFGAPSRGSTSANRIWRWHSIELAIAFADNVLSVKLIPVK